MNIDIPHITMHLRYNRTYLQACIVSLYFDEINEDYININKKEIDSYFKNEFNIQQNLNVETIINGFELKNSQKGINIIFNKNAIHICIEGNGYVTFSESVISQLSLVKEYIFGIINKDSAFDIAIRKVNIFGYNDESFNIDNEIDDVFSIFFQEKLGSIPFELDNEICKRPNIIKMEKAQINSNNILLTIRKGISSSNVTNNYNVILDTSAEYACRKNVEEGCLDRALRKLNDSLYDLYHFCVKRSVIESMNQE